MKELKSYIEAKTFEDKVGEILSALCVGDEIVVKEHLFPSVRLQCDYFLPLGCQANQWPNSTIVEVKSYFRYPTISRLYERYYPLYIKGVISKLVIIVDDTISENVKTFVSSFKSPYIEVIGYDELGSDNIPVKGSVGDNKSKSDILEKARDAFNNNRFSFFLGAGLSMDAKLPSWSELLAALLESEDNKPFKYINKANSDSIFSSMGYSTIVAGRYAQDGFLHNSVNNEADNNQQFIERIRKVLYKRYNKKSLLIKSVAQAVKRKKPAQIITYNYDDLLENMLSSKAFYSVSDNYIPRTKSIPIYHVHGMISRDKTKASNSVLSEREYHQLYRNPHNWANIVQLNALYTSTCFFVGFSMTDPNQRRLLELAREKDICSDVIGELPHFVFLKKDHLKGEAAEVVNEEHWHEIEIMMSDFGLNVIWFNEFEELPKIINYISGVSKEKPDVA